MTAPRASPRPSDETFDFRFNQAPNEQLYTALCKAYGSTGSVAWSEDLARLMDDFHPTLPAFHLARLIAANEIFTFDWCGATWVPMAQFDLRDMSVRPQFRQARQELSSHLDGWEVASWFVCPNEFLHGRRPLELMISDLPSVLEAARADRFVAVG